MKKLITVLFVAVTTMLVAEGENRWSLTLGPAWRARVKSSISGSSGVKAVSPSHTVVYDKDIAGHGEWSVGEVEKVQDPDYPGDPSYQKYAATRTATETTVTPYDANAGLCGADTSRPLGIKAGLGYDFYSSENFAIGVHAMFAAYWNMRSSASGYAGGGRIDVRNTTDYYLFNNGPIPDDTDFSYFRPESDPYLPYQTQQDLAPVEIPGQRVGARIRSNLYQIGVGPQAAWHALNWLDVYGRVEALCNIAHMDFDVGTANSTDTRCMFGVGGTLGCSAFFTDNFGVYVEAGYEWVDKAESEIGNAKCDVDFSSFILSAGLQMRF